MNTAGFGKLFDTDILTKRERVERALNHRPVDRVPLHEQLSYNPSVISDYTGKQIEGFEYTIDDICTVIRRTMDMCFPPTAPISTARVTDECGFVKQNDNWTSWHVSRPFADVEGARAWLKLWTRKLEEASFDAAKSKEDYRLTMQSLQQKVGDTVILNYTFTGLCSVYDQMGLELFSYFYCDYSEEMTRFMEVSVERELMRVHAVADRELSPAILIAEDFSTKQGPIFSPEFLHKQHFPYVKLLTEAWHSHGIKVIYHSDGNYKKAIPALMDCGVDGVNLMESGTPDKVRKEVCRHILETNALETGGMFVATSSEINPPIKPANFRAMVEAVGSMPNRNFSDF